METLFCLLQYVLPTHALSRLAHGAARLRWPWLKNRLIERFCLHYGVDLDEAEVGRAADYASFNAFFTRRLSPGARPLPDDPQALCCPVDGAVSQLGTASDGRLIQAKGRHYALAELLASDEDARLFNGGAFATLYLAPHNYHRVHMPLAGRLAHTRLVPGRLFSVNPASARGIARLFARNERLACFFETDLGPMAVVLVGALLVGSIETVWGGEATPPRARRIAEFRPGDAAPTLARGAELGRFNMGSSVIVLFPRDCVAWDAACLPGAAVRMGQAFARRL